MRYLTLAEAATRCVIMGREWWRNTRLYVKGIKEQPILGINAGTHSLRIGLYLAAPGLDPRRLVFAEALNLQIGDAHITYQGRGPIQERPLGDDVSHEDAFRILVELLIREEALTAFKVPDSSISFCYRTPQGGDYERPQIITAANPHLIHELRDLSPVANDLALRILEVGLKLYPTCKHSVHFDTAFHWTIAPNHTQYMINPEAANRASKSGHHGLSFSYATCEVYKTLRENEADSQHHPRLIIFHLGNVSSGCTVLHGKSVHTSAGVLTSGLPGAYDSGVPDAELFAFRKTDDNGGDGNTSMRLRAVRPYSLDLVPFCLLIYSSSIETTKFASLAGML